MLTSSVDERVELASPFVRGYRLHLASIMNVGQARVCGVDVETLVERVKSTKLARPVEQGGALAVCDAIDRHDGNCVVNA